MVFRFEEAFNEYRRIISEINNDIIRKFKVEFYSPHKIHMIQSHVDTIMHDSMIRNDIKFGVSFNGKDTVNIHPSINTELGYRIIDMHGFYNNINNEPTRDFLIYRYGDTGRWLDYNIKKMIKEVDDPCIDNFRVVEVGDPYEEIIYNIIIEEGCCGFEDREITHEPTGKKFKIGCNYGH